MRRSLAGAAVLVALGAVVSFVAPGSPRPAGAAYPGINGKIAFHSDRDGVGLEVYVMNADGSGQTHLTSNTSREYGADWRPISRDTDDDGSIDGYECSAGTDPASAASKPPSDSGCEDPDGDRVRSLLESRGWGTDPNNAGTDGDGAADGVEIVDVNGDGAANITDALITAKAAVGTVPFDTGALTAPEKHAYDLDRNGVVQMADAITVAKYVAGLPACG